MSTTPVLVNAETNRLQQARDQVRVWMSPLNVHIAAAVLLLLLNLWFVVQLLLTASGGSARGQEAIDAARAQQVAAELAARPLRGVDSKVATSQQGARRFDEARLPYGYADVATELGILRQHTGVRISRVQYGQTLPVNGLTEARLDAAVTGEYKPLAQFINGLERNRSFFLIQRITLNGTQNGQVNLRLGLTTFLREPMPSLAAAQAESGARP